MRILRREKASLLAALTASILFLQLLGNGVEESVFGGSGQYTWGGAGSTDFWIDRKQQLVGMILTQLRPTGTYPTRMIMNTATYEAVVELYE